MQNYLDKIRSVIPSLQINQIFKLLHKYQSQGKIKSINELQAELKTLTTELTTNKIKPTLSLYKAIIGKDISSETFNEMIERIDDDLETAFSEANNLFEILDAHNEIIERTALQMIERTLNKLEDEITIMEFSKNNNHGLKTVLFNTFKDTNGSLVYRDSPIGEVV
jgi:fumarate hydratase class II